MEDAPPPPPSHAVIAGDAPPPPPHLPLLQTQLRVQAPRTHLGVQRLDATVHNLGKARVRAHVDDGQAGAAQRRRRAASRQQLDAQRRQAGRKLDQARLVAYA